MQGSQCSVIGRSGDLREHMNFSRESAIGHEIKERTRTIDLQNRETK